VSGGRFTTLLLLVLLFPCRAPSLTLESVVGEAAGESVRIADLDAPARAALTRLWGRIHQTKIQALESLIDQVLDPGAREGVPPLPAPSLDSPWDRAAARAHAHLVEQWRRERQQQLEELRSTATIERFLPEPGEDGESAFADVVARIRTEGGATLALRDADIEAAARLRLQRLRAEAVETARLAFHRLAEERSLEREAARRDIDTQRLLDRLAAEAGPVTEREVREYYEARQESLGTYRPERIRSYLEFRRRAEARAALLRRLDAKSYPLFLLERPAVPRFGGASGADDPRADPDTVTLEVFSNLRCPTCEAMERALEELVSSTPDLHLVVRRRPLFPEALLGPWGDALASACSAAQGQDVAFRKALRRALQRDSETNSGALARQLVPDPIAFEACWEAAATRARVRTALRHAARIGLREAPAVLVNGLPLVGFQGAERLEEIVRSEAARSARREERR
jgi:predicted DsbA family dithiol-disulfide isomerase